MPRAAHLLARCSVIAAALASSAGALAQDGEASSEMAVTGTAPQVCTIDNGRFRTGELVNFVGADSDTLRIIELVDPTLLSVQSASADIAFAAVCNFPHRIRLESQDNGLWPVNGPVSADNADFATALPYSAGFVWADRTQTLEMDAKIRQSRVVVADIDEPAAGEVVISVNVDAGASNTRIGAPLLAGAYVDNLRIFLEPR